jgi:uncharacterized membrane protein
VTVINTRETLKEIRKNITFRWTYIALPAAVLLVVLVFAAVFFGKLPPDTAYRFSGDVPVSWLDRGGVLAWALGLQFIFFLLSLAITLLITGAARRMQLTETPLNRTLFTVIGNVVALPQIIITYATLDIFLYNIYSKALPPLWVFALLVMLVGGVVLAVLFARAFTKSRKLKTEKISGSESDV